MHVLIVCLMSVAFLISSKCYAIDSLQIIRLRPSYISLYEMCSKDFTSFKDKMYIKTYQNGLRHSLMVISLSIKEINETVDSNGISPELSQFLNQEVTSFALNDCIKDEVVHYAFIRNLVIIDTIAKAVGISIGIVGYHFLGKLSQKLFSKTLEKISPKLAKNITHVTAGATVATQLFLSKDDYAKIFSENVISEKSREAAANMITKGSSDSLLQKAQDKIHKIELMMKNPNLTLQDKEYLMIELASWKIILQEFSRAG